MAVLGSALFLSTAGLFIKLLPWHPMVITSLRSVVAVAFLLVLRLIVPPRKTAKNPPLPLFAAALLFALMMVFFVNANKITTAANAVMLQFGSPIWAALLGWWLIKEKPRLEHWGALVFIFIGLTLFLRDGLGGGALLGDALAVLAGICFGVHSVFLRMLKEGNPADAMLLAHIICAVIGLPFIIMFPPAVTVPSIFALLYMGVLQIGLASLLFAYGIKRIKAIHAMLIMVAEPIFNPIWVFAVTRETPSLVALAGGAIIILAVVASSFIGIRREEQLVKSEVPVGNQERS